MENKEIRIALCKRLHHLGWFYTQEYMQELDNKAEEEKKIQEMKESNEPVCCVLTADNNAKVMLDCMKATKAIMELLRDEDEDVEDWQISAINAALDTTNESNFVSFDLPYCILGMLGAQYRGEKYKKYM